MLPFFVIPLFFVFIVVMCAVGVGLWARRSGRPEASGENPRKAVTVDRPESEHPPRESLPPEGIVPDSPLSEEGTPWELLESSEMYALDDEMPSGALPLFTIEASSTGATTQLCVAPLGLFGITEGMSQTPGGEMAVQLTLRSLRSSFGLADRRAEARGRPPRHNEDLVAAVERADERVRSEKVSDEVRRRMGASVTLALFLPRRGRVHLTHIGRTRCYRIRAGVVEQLTTDHTLGALGVVDEDPDMLTRAVGGFERCELDVRVSSARPGDHFFMCAGPYRNMIERPDVRAAIADGRDPAEALMGPIDATAAGATGDRILLRLVGPAGRAHTEPTNGA